MDETQTLPLKLAEIKGERSKLEVWLRSDLQFAVMIKCTELKELVSITLNASEMNEIVDRIKRVL